MYEQDYGSARVTSAKSHGNSSALGVRLQAITEQYGLMTACFISLGLAFVT
jgi:hypothetical protein